MPIIASNTRTAQVAAQENAQKEYLCKFKEYIKIFKVILKLTTNTFENKYLQFLANWLTEYSNITVVM